MHDPKLLFDVLFLLLAAVVIVPLFQALRIPAVLGYLVGGALLGPHTPGPVVDMELPQVLSEFGVVFLLFAIGLELPLSRLQAMRRYIFGLGLMQVALTSAAIAAVAYALGENMAAALVIGGMLAFSSTATVLKLLVERGETVARFGRVSVAVLIFQDLAVVPLLTLLPLLAGGDTSLPWALALAGAKAVAAIGDELDLANRIRAFGPGAGDVVVIDGATDDLVDAERLELADVGNEPGQVRGVAGRRERTRHGKEDDYPLAQHGIGRCVDGLAGSNQLDGDGRNRVAARDRHFTGWLPCPNFSCRPRHTGGRAPDQSPAAADTAELIRRSTENGPMSVMNVSRTGMPSTLRP